MKLKLITLPLMALALAACGGGNDTATPFAQAPVTLAELAGSYELTETPAADEQEYAVITAGGSLKVYSLIPDCLSLVGEATLTDNKNGSFTIVFIDSTEPAETVKIARTADGKFTFTDTEKVLTTLSKTNALAGKEECTL